MNYFDLLLEFFAMACLVVLGVYILALSVFVSCLIGVAVYELIKVFLSLYTKPDAEDESYETIFNGEDDYRHL